MNNIHIYHLVHVNKRGQHTRLTEYPTTHKQCCTIKSKQSSHNDCMLVEHTLIEGEFERMPQWAKDCIMSECLADLIAMRDKEQDEDLRYELNIEIIDYKQSMESN